MLELSPYEFCLVIIEGQQRAPARRPMSKEVRKTLHRLTGQDFGLNVSAWAEWVRRHRRSLEGLTGEALPRITEWTSCADLGPLLALLEEKATDRQMRLFMVACCRRAWHLLDNTDPRE